MRCIEIQLLDNCMLYTLRLTLTWDVLKFSGSSPDFISCFRLTLTWDVLKWFNISGTPTNTFRLTLTWDVLK